MSSKRRTSKRHTQEAGHSVNDRSRIAVLMACFAGLVFAICVCVLQHHWVRFAIHSERDNSLLVTQQLDEIYRAIEKRILEDPSRIDLFVDSLQVFYLYDRQFVEQNARNSLTRSESAVAAHRLAQYALLLGNLQESKAHYKSVKDLLTESIARTPETKELVLGVLVEATAKIAWLEKLGGNLDLSKRELREALQLVKGTPARGIVGITALRDMATLCEEHGLNEDSHWLAQRIEREENRAAIRPGGQGAPFGGSPKNT